MTRLFLVFSCIALYAVTVNAAHHPCQRPCVARRPQVCEYNFTIEWYYTLSKACHKCPFLAEDCLRPHCVSADGYQRPLVTINRQMPGPAIEVCEGDTVRVWVENKMEDGSSTSIHWHGLIQNHTGFMDGVSRLTQCGIPPFEVFRYEFNADNAGTHWYHSHEGMQLGDGLLGPFIVRKPAAQETHASLYDEDSSDHVLMLQDWSKVPVFYRYMEEMNWIWRWPPPMSGLINGMGRKYEVTDTGGIWTADKNSTAFTPYRVFTVNNNRRYRFRLIGAMGRCFFRFSIDDHQLVVIETDGHPLKPSTVDALMIHPGERYDVVVNADQAVSNYWIRADGLGDCGGTDGDAVAILRYNGAADVEPAGNLSIARTGTTFNPNPVDQNENDIATSQMEFGGDDEDFSSETVDIIHYIRMVYLGNDNTRYNHPDYYPVADLPAAQAHITPTLNKITNKFPVAPPLTQWEDAEINMCSRDSVIELECNQDLCYCTHMLEVELGQVVELFVVGDTGDPHQMHLHGQNFRVVAFGQHDYELETVDLQEIINNDRAGLYPRKLVNAPRMDTVAIHRQSYAVIRFKAENPGMWFFHCHNEGHLMQGMSMFIKVGQAENFPTPPLYFPRCGGYNYYSKKGSQVCEVSSADKVAYTPMGTVLAIAILTVLL